MELLILFLALVFSGISILISVMSWRKSRTIYGFKRYPLRMATGSRYDLVIDKVDEEINKELGSGKWTIVDIVHRKSDNDYDVILGKIKQ